MRKSITIQLFFLLLLTNSSLAQISIPAETIISENFNLIGPSGTATLPLNWKMSSAGTGTTSGWATGTNITATTQAASSGSPTTGGAYNWATTAGTDRAIGFMTDGSYASPNSVIAFYRNTTGSTVTTITVLFAIERYRVNTSAFSLSFFSSTDGSAWTARAAGDISAGVFTTGASAYNFGSPQTIYKTLTITGLSIANNGDFYLRWVFTNTGSTNSQGIALDDVSLFAGAATPGITAKLRDLLTIDNPPINQVNPGDQLTYRTTIKNTGTGDANAVNLTIPAPTNTTLVVGSVKTSALAKDDSYATPFNTALTGNNVISNDFGLPSVTVISFGPVKNAAATAAGGSGSSDNGATVVVNPDGTFSYTPPSGFIGIDKFAYIITTGNAPDNDAIVTISVGTVPSVTNDSYTAIGNMQINPIGTSNLLNNDAGNGIQIVAVNGNPANVGNTFTTANGSNLTVSANGDFIYNPGPGFDGPESFTYTIDNGFSSPQTATVNITISGMVWFINAAAAAGGDGRLSAPFNTIAAYNAAAGANPPAANDNIFVYENPVPYSGSFTLLNGQRLIGQDATASLSTITGLTPAAYSSAFPAMNTGAPVTTLITTVAATNAVNLGSGNILRGFTLGNTTGSGINGTGFGTLVIADVSKNGTGQAVALSTGAFGSPATIDNITTTSSVNAVSLAGCTGTLTISTGAISGSTGSAFTINGGTCSAIYSGGITQANNAAMVSISGGHATGTITFQTGTLSATNGTGLQFDNADGIYNFNGTTTLNGGDAGIDILNGSAGSFTFGTGTGITSPSGIAFNIGGTASTCIVTYNGSITQANNAAMVSVSGGHTTGTVTFQTGTLSATNGTGLQFDNADGIYNFNGTTTLNGGDAGIDIINGSGGNFSFTNAPITNPTGVAFLVNGGSGSIGHTGVISKTSAGILIDIQSRTGGSVTINSNLSATTSSTGINVSNCTGGTITFDGSVKTMNTSGNNPVNLVTNTGATINFTNGGLAITSTTATGFNATGGGNVTVTGAGNTITKSGNGTAVNINSTNAGAGGINFASVNVTGGTGQAINITTSTGTKSLGDVDVARASGGSGIFASAAGTLNTTTGTINSGNQIAIDIDNTALGMTLERVDVNGGANGIDLNTTTGSFTINGTGTTGGSGGTIQNTTGRGASFISATGITLKNMNFTNAGTTDLDATNGGLSTGDNLATNASIHLVTVTTATLDNLNITGGAEQGINGNTVSTFSLTNSSIVDAGNEPDEDGIHFYNMSGTCVIANTTINCTVVTPNTTGGDDHLNLQMQSGTLTLTISGGSATNANKGSGYLFGIRGTANATLNLISATSTGNFSGGIVADAFDNALMDLNVTNSTSTGNNDQLSVSAGDNSNVDLIATGNTLRSLATGDFVVISLLGSALDIGYTFDASISNNTISVANGLTADGISIFNAGGGLFRTTITNNSITYAGTQRAILIQGGQDGTSQLHTTVTGNAIDIQLDGTGNAAAGILAQTAVASPSGDNSFLCVDIGGSTAALRNTFTHSLGGTMAAGDIRVRQRFVTTVRLPGYAGANNDNAAVVTYLAGRNTLVNVPTATATNEVGVTAGAGGFVGGAACTQPTF